MYFYVNYFNYLLIFFYWNFEVFFNFKYLLVNLLSIEFLMLGVFFNIFINLIIFNYEMFFLVMFLTFMVCESVLGLSLLISLVRILGNSNIQNLNLLKL